ncbi:heavy-metal-associated domain-containing protein [Paenimyroides baculatum]|uniref:Heavy-metal-associated domain-containing protein n=1 Tax=Paenimyroides baculatum TaxID=2608000 RepID=A0A5M6CRK0_9FLAO|nr:heavy-metal-associated domain-containing protein [Paenimyroides baculatum]KAA5535735.1 heavy-metal-associated domain-containing protein [Paenimyroides baculatum]
MNQNIKIANLKGLFTAFFLLCTVISKAQMSKIELQATGLTCSMCSNAIYKQLETIPGVEKIDTDLNTNTFTVALKQGNELTPRVFKEKVEKAGFFVGSFIVTTTDIIKQNNYIIIDGKAKSQKATKFKVLDKGYLTDKEYKKAVKNYKEIASYSKENETDFHVKVLN